MRKCFSTSFILLAVSVLGVVLNDDVYENEREGSAAVIQCPYAANYKTYPKYFCKGVSIDCKTLLETDGQTDWMLQGRLSLYDNTEKSMFVVTINNLSIVDEGQYGCGVKITGQDLFTVVHLTVRKGLKKQLLPTLLTSVSTFTAQGSPISAVTSRPGCQTDSTGSSFYVKKSLSGIFACVGGAFVGVLLLLLIILCVFKCRVIKGSAGTTWPNSTKKIENMKDVSIYEGIQHSNPAGENISETPDIMSTPNP
ncbi:CMRF35-like molecule 5 [Neoarius graeffei]|uniref:CMRF35-like molecule 5 n=1 Tax=Neoarius graeffei TaxID=443677 RepID=UPI00298C3140|nr:CMRF35-like molecule 5 [Neoarius graeffei]